MMFNVKRLDIIKPSYKEIESWSVFFFTSHFILGPHKHESLNLDLNNPGLKFHQFGILNLKFFSNSNFMTMHCTELECTSNDSDEHRLCFNDGVLKRALSTP